VTGEDGRGVIGFPLKRTWDDGSRRWVYSDHSDERQDIRVDKKAIKASCDTAAEAMALMEVSIRAQADLLAIRKQAESRIKVLRGIVLPRESDVVMLVLDEQVDWVNPETGKTLLSIYEKDR
jgi:hypothetical protein